jgi:hypothetical protein
MCVYIVYIKKSKFIYIYYTPTHPHTHTHPPTHTHPHTHPHTHTHIHTVEVTDPLILAATVQGEGLAEKEKK